MLVYIDKFRDDQSGLQLPQPHSYPHPDHAADKHQHEQEGHKEQEPGFHMDMDSVGVPNVSRKSENNTYGEPYLGEVNTPLHMTEASNMAEPGDAEEIDSMLDGFDDDQPGQAYI